MSQNRTDFPGTTPKSGQTGNTTGQTGSGGYQSDRSTTGNTGTTGTTGSTGTTGTTGTSGTGTGTATGLAQEYGGKISEAATQAKEYVSDKMTVVGDKIKELKNTDLTEITENAKDYARTNPGQAILISAAAGLLVGLILRGSRR